MEKSLKFMTRDQEDDLPDEKSSRANGVFGPSCILNQGKTS